MGAMGGGLDQFASIADADARMCLGQVIFRAPDRVVRPRCRPKRRPDILITAICHRRRSHPGPLTFFRLE
eukprot:5757561-Pyramimonas_sp.AAC.1